MYARFIPTCVGNIIHRYDSALSLAVHPHVCGEHNTLLFELFHFLGSSPRVWGTYHPEQQSSTSGRFIPTCVGNIRPQVSLNSLRTVHPHVCGEHFFIGLDLFIKVGSSPRVWGTSQLNLISLFPRRFIPTCVGNIYVAHEPSALCSVHPHVCGEHFINYCFDCSFIGSSPRVWGTFHQLLF